jgi:hypothetical protein
VVVVVAEMILDQEEMAPGVGFQSPHSVAAKVTSYWWQ